MAETVQYTCDICGAVKGEANHWWISDQSSNRMDIAPWEQLRPGRKHLCGEACVLKAVAAFMESQKLAPKNSPK